MQTYGSRAAAAGPTAGSSRRPLPGRRDVGDNEMSDDIRWIRSYVLAEEAGGVGTVCIYQASSPETIRDHASRADLPVTEIVEVADTVIVRPDPEPPRPSRTEG